MLISRMISLLLFAALPPVSSDTTAVVDKYDDNTSAGGTVEKAAPTTSEAGRFLLPAKVIATQPAENSVLGTQEPASEPSPRSDGHGSGSAPESPAAHTEEAMPEPHADEPMPEPPSHDPPSNSTAPPPSNGQSFQHVDLYVGSNGEITLQKPDGSAEHSQAGNQQDDKPIGHNERLVTRQLLDASIAMVMLDLVRAESPGYKFAQIIKDWKPEPLPETSMKFGPAANRDLTAQDIWAARKKQIKDANMYVLGHIGVYWNMYNYNMSFGAMALNGIEAFGKFLKEPGVKVLENIPKSVGGKMESVAGRLIALFKAKIPGGLSIMEQGGPWGLAAIGVQLMVMSYQLSDIQDKVSTASWMSLTNSL